MQKMKINYTEIEGLYTISAFSSYDERGFFIKDYSYDFLTDNNVTFPLKETFYSFSKKGVIRGLHFQNIIQQPKLVRCISGHVFDVAVDLRRNSATYKKWKAFDLQNDGNLSLLIPGGFAHGFLALEDSLLSYKCAECFKPEYDSGIIWSDKDLDIDWPIDEIGGNDKIIISNKDAHLQSYQHFFNNYEDFLKL